MMDLPSRASRATPCAFMTTSTVVLRKPKRAITAASVSHDGASNGRITSQG